MRLVRYQSCTPTMYVEILIALVLYILVFGPTLFIIENTSTSIGLWASNFIHMSLYTDAINQAKFPQNWTAYFWAY